MRTVIYSSGNTLLIGIFILSLSNSIAFLLLRQLNARNQPLNVISPPQSRVSSQFEYKSPQNEPNIMPMFEDSLIEISEPKTISVEGSIPEFVRGTLIRNGPGLFGALPSENTGKTRRRFSHIFDGMGKLCRFHISSDGVKFSTRFLRSSIYQAMVERKEDIPPCVTAGPTVPPFTLWQRIKSLFTASDYDNTCVNVVNMGNDGDNLLATTDAAILTEFNPDTLDTIRMVKMNDDCIPTGYDNFFCTAHPKQRVSLQGNKYTYNYHLIRKTPGSFSLPFFGENKKQNYINIIRTDSSFNRKVVGYLDYPDGDLVPYLHDIGITDKYVILALWPVYHYFPNFLNGKGFMPQLIWKGDEEPTRIFVYDIGKFDDGKSSENIQPIAEFEAPAAFAYHHINAYEEEDATTGTTEIIFDVTGYENAKIANGEYGYLYLENIKDPEKRKLEERDGTCYRYRLPINQSVTKQKVHPTILKAIGSNGLHYTSDLVRMNPNYETKPYRFSYGPAGFAGEDLPYRGGYLEWALLKQDHKLSEMNTKMSQDHKKLQSAFLWKAPQCYPSEPLFVPDHNGEEEDDGALVSVVFDANRQESFLLFLNAKDMTELARAYLGVIVPVTFHGQFYPTK